MQNEVFNCILNTAVNSLQEVIQQTVTQFICSDHVQKSKLNMNSEIFY